MANNFLYRTVNLMADDLARLNARVMEDAEDAALMRKLKAEVRGATRIIAFVEYSVEMDEVTKRRICLLMDRILLEANMDPLQVQGAPHG